jgi:hypothetical protein
MQGESIWAKICGLPVKLLSLRNLLAVYFLINSIGLILFSMLVAGNLAKLAQPSVYVYASLYPWAKPAGGAVVKIASLLQYVLPVVVLFIYYTIYLRVSKLVLNKSMLIDKDPLPKIGLYFWVAVVVNAILLVVDKERVFLVAAFYLLWILSYLYFFLSIIQIRTPFVFISKWFLSAFLFVILAQISTIFVPLIINPMTIENNYINISEKTILKTGKVVDNLDYINEHRIAGFALNDPRKNGNDDNFNDTYPSVTLESCKIVLQTLKALAKEDEEHFSCNEKTKIFTAKTRLSLADKFILDGLALPLEDKKNLDALFISSASLQKKLSPPLYSKDEQDFIRRNTAELLNQAKAGWFFYHHGYSFGPMNALSLGASAYKQTMVYGWLNTVTQSKVLDLLGMPNYQGYFKIYFAEYLAYFIIFLLGIWAIFRRLETVVFAATLATSALLLLGIELIRLAPGFNPVRHIFDVPVFYLLYRYLAQERKIDLILACALAIFALLWNKDFGLYLTLSVGGALLFKGMKQRPFHMVPLLLGGVTAIAGMFLFFYPMPGANPTAIYMLLGVGSPQATSGVIFGLLILVSLLLAATMAIKQNEAYTILTVGMALYFVQSLTYYIWYPVAHHILGVAPVFILWLVALFHGWVIQDKSKEGIKWQHFIILLLMLFVYLPASASFYWRQLSYNKIFKSHQLYNWTFDKARFKSTMEPALFEEAANLIKQNSKNDNGIFIVSKYDNILPILAGKYSAMPYNELPTNLVSPREIEVASEAILKNKPAFLFVDSDIGRNLNGEVPLENDPATISLNIYGEARGRAMVLQGLSEVYIRVAGSYALCASGRIISVYCRKPD